MVQKRDSRAKTLKAKTAKSRPLRGLVGKESKATSINCPFSVWLGQWGFPVLANLGLAGGVRGYGCRWVL